MKNYEDTVIVSELKAELENEGQIDYRLIYHKVGELYGVEGMGYSIEIVSWINGEKEEIFIEDVTRDRKNAVWIIGLFAENAVTPDSAEYIIEDILS